VVDAASTIIEEAQSFVFKGLRFFGSSSEHFRPHYNAAVSSNL
jgi:hypothetical protein